MYTEPMLISPVANAIRQLSRIKATVSAIHVSGLPVEANKEVLAEMLEPSRDLVALPPDVREKAEANGIPRKPKEPVFSVHVNGREGRMVFPLSKIQNLTFISSAESGGADALAEFREQLVGLEAFGFLILTGEEHEPVILACTGRPRGVQKLMKYWQNRK